MQQREQIDQEQGSDYLSQVTAGNRGRRISLDVIGGAGVSPDSRDELSPAAVGLTDAPFLSLEYDPVDKGNAIVISSGVDQVAYEHAVEAPTELTANIDPDGRLDSLEILDQNGARTKLNFF
jgi:hypothetical protein